MIEYAHLYHAYTMPVIRIWRYVLAGGLLWFAYSHINSGQAWHIPLACFLLIVISEIFFHFKIARVQPEVSLLANDGKDILRSFTLHALTAYTLSDKTSTILGYLFKKEGIAFILQKAAIEKSEIVLSDIPKEELGKMAFAIAKEVNGTFVTTLDLFAAYMLLTDATTKLLFQKDLKKEEFLDLVFWARADFSFEEKPQPQRVIFWGEGIGEEWISGWTLETKKYVIDLTKKVLQEKPLLVGRDTEYRIAVETLGKKENNNILLVGQAGSGKTTLIHKLAFENLIGTVQNGLLHRRFYELLVGSLVAGAANQGDLETRLNAIIDEIAHAGNVVIVIPQLQDIVGASTFHINLSSVLLPYLREGKIPIVGTTSKESYKRFIDPLADFRNAFTLISCEKPDEKLARQMMLEKATYIEKTQDVFLTYKAIVTAVKLANRYMQDKALPGSAVTLLMDTAASVSLQKRKTVREEDVVKKIEEATHVAVAAPKTEEKTLLLHLEDKFHERVVAQEDAVHGIAQALRRVRSGITEQQKPISFLFLGPTGVGKTEVAKTLASVYFGSDTEMIRLDMSEYKTADAVNRLLGASAGQGGERGELTDKVHDHPFSLILLDEFEKAHPSILDLFLQVLDDGRLTDNKGRLVSFANTIIIATSNAASEFIREAIKKDDSVDAVSTQKLLEFMQTNNIFKPELLNRFDAIVTFKPLEEKEIMAVVKHMLKAVSQKLSDQDITVSFDEKVVEKIAKEGFDKQFGARPLRRYIQNTIEDLLAQKILKDEIQRGSTVAFSVGEKNTIAFIISS